jgi:hypothetical protein
LGYHALVRPDCYHCLFMVFTMQEAARGT